MTDRHTERIGVAKRANSTRRIDLKQANKLLSEGEPSAGDLVLARVTKLGHHDGVELATGRRATLYVGDEILVCYGNRYAPDQFEALVPPSIGPCHLVAAGGLAALAVSRHTSMNPPTEIEPVGIVADEKGIPLNIRRFRIDGPTIRPRIPVIVSVGTSMNSGKTTAAAKLIRGLTLLGHRVGAAKVTGTSAGKDTWLMHDSGAHLVLDFNDAGFATTYKESIADIEDGALRLIAALEQARCEIAVLEVADGLLQNETRELLSSERFKNLATSVVFSSVDSMGAIAGAAWLSEIGYDVATLAGVMTNSPLASREASMTSGLEVTLTRDLQSPDRVEALFPFARRDFRGFTIGSAANEAICA